MILYVIDFYIIPKNSHIIKKKLLKEPMYKATGGANG